MNGLIFFWNGGERDILLSYHLIVGTNPLWIGIFVRLLRRRMPYLFCSEPFTRFGSIGEEDGRFWDGYKAHRCNLLT